MLYYQSHKIAGRRSPVAGRRSPVAWITLGCLIFCGTAFADPGDFPSSKDEIESAVMAALQQRFELSSEEVELQLAAQEEAYNIHDPLKTLLGDAWAGAWYDPERLQLTVAVTDPAFDSRVRLAGARPVPVERTLDELRAVMDLLHLEVERNADWQDAVTSLYIDYPSNRVMIEVLPGLEAAVRTRLGEPDWDQAAIQLVASPGCGQVLTQEVWGGDPYLVGSSPHCTIGFSVEGGYITAGHCGWGSLAVNGHNGQPQGYFAGSTYPPTIWYEPEVGLTIVAPNKDLAWVSTNSSWTLIPEVNPYDHGLSPWIVDSSDGYVGVWVCRYGQTTGGPHCGNIQQFDVTAYLYDGNFDVVVPFTGMIRADTCAFFGDSGGPLVRIITPIHHAYAVGTLTGGFLGCPGSGPMHFAPVNAALNDFNLTLLTIGGN